MLHAFGRFLRVVLGLGPRHNADIHWELFDPKRYYEHNYQSLRDDDRDVIVLVRDYFSAAATGLPVGARGLDVGPGSNLYPAMAMLPFCASIDLRERSQPNVDWLVVELQSAHRSWHRFWRVFADDPCYLNSPDPWEQLRRKVFVSKADVLVPQAARWDIGTMMFVAESMTEDVAEFSLAIRLFLASLKPSSPFAMAFMTQSEGYLTGKQWFPAVKIDQPDVEEALAGLVEDLQIKAIPTPAGGPVRKGYGEMLLVLGRTVT